MPPFTNPADRLRAAAEDYQRHDNLGVLLDCIRELAETFPPAALKEACVPFLSMPEVVIPVYERVTAAMPDDAQAMVVLANAYWLTGRGSDVVGELATRAISVDAANRGAWHLWALSESNVRERVVRWRQVAERFPTDQLARAALADNAASLAGAEHDPLALDLAIATYQDLLDEAAHPVQRAALDATLKTLRGWKL
jgi:hypothetical protein